MFKAGQTSPYDDLVAKATDENLTSENWEVILTLCDKVQDEGETGARNVVAAVIKRLAHRSPNVQLYSLALSESLSKNCGVDLHRELASRAFTQALEKLITDRTTHDKVRKRALHLIAVWTTEFEKDPSLGVMEEFYNNLKAKSYKFEAPDEPAPPAVDDEVRRREEEELQRVLEMSMHDKGGRGAYTEYTGQSSGAGASGAGAGAGAGAAGPSTTSETGPSRASGYVPAQSPPRAASSTTSLPSQGVPVPLTASTPIFTRVKALHTFEPTEPGELAFEKGDIITVVDRGYKDWWRGQLKGRTGIFPVNYVEPLPEPTAAELAKGAEQEAAVFAQAVNVDRLLTMLRGLESSGESLADNEEIQELYRSCMSLRPKIVKLIDKYSQKRADLVSMNETFVKARVIFDRMMEDSIRRHTGMYDAGQQQDYGREQAPYEQKYSPQPPYRYAAATPGYDQHTSPPYGYVLPAGYPDNQYPQQHGDPGYGTGQGYPYHTSLTEAPQGSQPPVHIQAEPEPSGPPYVYDPHAAYADPSVQAWAQYYAQGGKDPAGAVYFFSVPGVTDPPSDAVQQVPPAQLQGVQPQGQSLSPTQPAAQPQYVASQPNIPGQPSYSASTSSQPPGPGYDYGVGALQHQFSEMVVGSGAGAPPQHAYAVTGGAAS